MQEEITTLPAVTTGENGSGKTTATYQYYDQNSGNLTWEMDANGYLTYNVYDSLTGRLETTYTDVNTNQRPPSRRRHSVIWSASVTPNPNGQNSETDYYYDGLGRTILTLGPAHFAVTNNAPPAPRARRSARPPGQSTTTPTTPCSPPRAMLRAAPTTSSAR